MMTQFDNIFCNAEDLDEDEMEVPTDWELDQQFDNLNLFDGELL